MKKGGLFVICAAVIGLVAGCAAMEEHDKAIRGLNVRVNELETQSSTSNARIDELDNKFHLLQEKLQSTQAPAGTPISTQSPDAAGQSDVNPPEGLKVVSLGGDEPTAGVSAIKPTAPAGKIAVEDLASRRAGASSTASGTEAAPDVLYTRGQDFFISGRYAEARGVFKKLVDAYPKSDLADNALYWIGESYYSERDFPGALSVFLDVLERYPKGNKAPDAMLKAGFSYMEMNNPKKADETLAALLKRYPDSEAAVKAKKTHIRLPRPADGASGQ